MVFGWKQISGKWSYFDPDGSMVKSGWRFLWLNLPDGSKKRNWKYFNKNGENIIKFFHEKNNTHLSLVGPNTEYAKGWYKLGRAWTYYKGNWGVRAEGEWLNLPVKLPNGRVEIARKYFNNNGYSVSSFYRGADSRGYYSLSGPDRYLYYGWKKLGNNTYYFTYPTGKTPIGKVTVDGKVYSFNARGILIK